MAEELDRLGIPIGEPDKDNPPALADVVAVEIERPTGEELFEGMTEEQQNENFGEEIAQALRDGKITLQDATKREGDFVVQRPASDLDL